MQNILNLLIRLFNTFNTFNKFHKFDRFNKLHAGGIIIPRLVKGLGDRTTEIKDKYLRDSVVVTVHTRNIGQ